MPREKKLQPPHRAKIGNRAASINETATQGSTRQIETGKKEKAAK
jgi:hypothetical protein